MREQEGFIPVAGEHRVWYRIVGGGADHEKIPLLTLHGGPGVGHDYIENLVALASDTRRVILYDQLGCGRSDQPDDTSLWRVDRFVEELATIRRGLDLDRVHLLSEIRVPTLITSGRHDESTPRINEVLHKGIVGSEWVIFENSSHMAHVEEHELYMPTVRSFLERIEAQL